MCSAPISIDRHADLPPRDAIGTAVMIAALGRIIGCARLTGVVTIIGEIRPGLEHPNAAAIRHTLLGQGDMFGPRLWVFEDGVAFDVAVPVDLAQDGRLLPVPEELHDELLAARRKAMRQAP